MVWIYLGGLLFFFYIYYRNIMYKAKSAKPLLNVVLDIVYSINCL